MCKWNYYKEDGKLYRFKIEQDEEPINPRKDWDGNIGTLNLWWNRYALGDNDGKGNPDDILNELISDNVPEEEYNEEFVMYECSRLDKIKLLSKHIIILPCYIYEHGGLTISCSNASYPYNDRFDSGCAGFICTTKEKCFEMWGVKEMSDFEWKARAARELTSEIHDYDMYLCNECYGYVEQIYNPEIDDWDDYEDCWGYLTVKWGDDLIEFFRAELTKEPLITEDEAIKLADEMHHEYETMEQANNIVCI